MAGIEQTKDAVRFALKFSESCSAALSDGKVSLWDLREFIDDYEYLQDAIEGSSKIPEELADLDESECKQLEQMVDEEFNIDHEFVEESIKAALKATFYIVQLINRFIPKPDSQ